MFWKLPPVRSPVPRLQASDGADHVRRILGRDFHLYGSGTQALARALIAAKRERPSASDVLLPAYACPDLVAACAFAGLTPRLIDLCDDHSWSLDLRQVSDLCSESTAAMVAMNLLGVGDGIEELLPIATQAAIPIIQDSAQALSKRAVAGWRANHVVVSFGRGKPLNLLGGGALLTLERLSDSNTLSARTFGDALHDLALRNGVVASLFNIATHPRCYWLASRLPGLRVGATTYRPLQRIVDGSAAHYGMVQQAMCAHFASRAHVADWRSVAKEWTRFGIHALAPDSAMPHDLLRFPLLAANVRQRQAIISALDELGVGCSVMYEFPLHRLAGAPRSIAAQGPFPVAESFAARFFTLPTHAFVTPAIVDRVDRCIKSVR